MAKRGKQEFPKLHLTKTDRRSNDGRRQEEPNQISQNGTDKAKEWKVPKNISKGSQNLCLLIDFPDAFLDPAHAEQIIFLRKKAGLAVVPTLHKVLRMTH